MAVNLIGQSSFSGLVQAVEIEHNPAPIRKNEAVKTNGETRLIAVGDCCSGPNDSGSAGYENLLTIAGIKGDGNLGEYGAGEITGELSHQDSLKKRAFVDTLPARRVYYL